MKVNCVNNKDITFDGIYNSKATKKVLKFAANNSYLFDGTVSLVLATLFRPAAILATPKTDKENKRIACSKAISSTAINYLITLGLALPFAKSIKKIDKEPAKYLKKETISALKAEEKELQKSKAYILATETFKLGIGLLVATPKAILNAATTPVVMDKVFKEKDTPTDSQNTAFRGKKSLANGISNIMNKKWFQNYVNKFKDTNFLMHMRAGTDILTTATFITQANKSKKIKEENKKPLLINTALSTGLCIASGYCLDKSLDKPTEKFIEKFKKINANEKELNTYVKGIKIAKPALILGGIYYIVIPMISTFFADRFSKKKDI